MKKTRDEQPVEKTAEPAASEPTTAPVPVPVEVPLITVEKFVRSIANKELAGAYAHVESMRRPVRRMSREDWQKDFDAWCAAPRR